jgi:hypothetical protein
MPSFFEPKIEISKVSPSPRQNSFFEQTQPSDTEKPFGIKPIPTEVVSRAPPA